LTKLELLDLSGNHDLNSTIPSRAMGTMSSLRILDLTESNKIHGTLPTQLGLLSSSLQHLRLAHTSLTGRLPTEIISLTHLDTLQIQGTAINGMAPVGLCQLSSLQQLAVACTSPFTSLQQTQLDACSCCECIGF
jgi:hypothetical protein